MGEAEVEGRSTRAWGSSSLMDGREEGRRKQSLAAGLGGAGGAAPEFLSAHARPGTSDGFSGGN